ncbi:hypothetical protein IQ273_22305 [Nodosilinea sp. LEGE 07298]|uniref:hypothetical protein n=1 Tax=Nodosilinea sp. LEGE 07298 TaxID=2777970 RepID=UPI00187E1AFA|nr:hypothetical protein [Nodosilinea sp. LEGE 07298]MBE9112141.1 hypothetical protein [Nodosilinea sp. LEGE 07298]
MFTQLLWQPQQIHNDVLTRASVQPQTLTWYQTTYPGISFGSFEANSTVQDHPVTMLTQFAKDGYFPLQALVS